METNEEIEKLLSIDSQEKKKAGRGIFKRTASRKGGCKGAVKTACDFMSLKEKRQYRKAGEINTYMYIPTLSELETMPIAEGRKKYAELRETYKAMDLRKEWKTGNYTITRLNKKFGWLINPETENSSVTSATIEFSDGLTISLNGEFDGKELQNRLLALGQVFTETTRYKLQLKILEIL